MLEIGTVKEIGTLRELRELGPFGSWSPVQLFSNSELGILLDLSPTTVFQDSAMTTPSTTGDPVGAVLDASGNDFHLVQATTLSKPTLQQDANWNHHLAFDGVDDIMTATFPEALGNCTLVFAGAEQVSVMYPVNVGTTFDLHTGPCYGLILINRELTAEELGGGGI